MTSGSGRRATTHFPAEMVLMSCWRARTTTCSLLELACSCVRRVMTEPLEEGASL